MISNALKLYSQKRSIKIEYAAPYMHRKNKMTKRCWKNLATMKDALLIDNGLPMNFWAEAMNTSNYLRNRLPIKCCKHIIIPKEV